ncbi:G-PROTEIN-RECEP-F1-2 domain-containing protein [Aphelenchoides bicaudatus]|nr:G-PROTEIN-RECEP-F1-2 domain-containing protein [Aphelenchoides bicaudatus]
MSAIDKRCLNDSLMFLTHANVERTLNAYFIPFITLFGVSGNLINLTVLLTPSLRSRSNKLLAALAITDIMFLLLMLPHALANYHSLEFNSTFRRIYFYIEPAATSLANWCSAVAIWLILTICFERLIGIRYPLSSRKGKFCNTAFLITGIVVSTGVLTAYRHFSHDCMVKIFCDGTQVHRLCYYIESKRWFSNQPNPHSTLLKHYVRWSMYFNAIGLVLLPTVLIVFSNLLLVKTLNERKAFLRVSTSVKSDSADGKSTNQMNSQLKTEQRVTLTVCLIVSSFLITQTPSAIYNLYELFTAQKIHTIRAIVNLLVSVGKSLNFLLFCLSSPSFRSRLVSLTKNRFNRSMNKSFRGFTMRKVSKLSVETEMTVSCSCNNENHSLLRNPAEPCRCSSRAQSVNDGRHKSLSRTRNNTVEFNLQGGQTEF